MFKKILLSSIIAAAFLMSSSEKAQAIIVNPAPLLLNDDTDASIFSPTSSSIGFATKYDITTTLPSGWFSVFGFYYVTDPSTKITVFGSEDTRTLPQSASIDFNSGNVYDLDDGGSIQSSFLAQAGSGIGFFQYYYNSDPVPYTLMENSEAYLNIDGLDAFAAFQYKSYSNAYLVGFNHPPSNTFLSYEVVGGITPVPEPSTLILLGSGAVALGFFNRKRSVSRGKKSA
ncbi:MAG: PEP-CTERM sorting domain-containing protein [Deltaproteobacteria bacterium]